MFTNLMGHFEDDLPFRVEQWDSNEEHHALDVNGPMTLDNSSSSRPRSEVAHQQWQVFGIHHNDCDDTITRSSDEPLSNMSVVLTVTRMAELGFWNFSAFRRDHSDVMMGRGLRGSLQGSVLADDL